MNKNTIYIIIIIVALAIAAYLLWQTYQPAGTPVGTPSAAMPQTSAAAPDTTSKINQDLEAVNINGLDKEFQSVDADLNSL